MLFKKANEKTVIIYYNGLSVYALHASPCLPHQPPFLLIHVLKPIAQCDSVRRWDLWEVTWS